MHDHKPPFLDGKTVFTTQQEMVSVVKDPNSDLAQAARNGSQMLQEWRDKQERLKMRSKFWELVRCA